VPVWHARTREWVKQGRLVLLGITQEQHAERCRLFAQWKGLDWPILHDPIDVMEAMAVPIVVAIDEHGIVRMVGPKPDRFEAEFLDRTFDDDAPPVEETPAGKPDENRLKQAVEARPDASSYRALGDMLSIWGGPTRAKDAIDAYEQALKLDPSDKLAMFRLGVAHRVRYESPTRQPGDFQSAVDAWGKALALDPNQYIWRRRIEQYGPRLAKPYPFYDWVEQARTEIAQRGETPVSLPEEPYGTELAGPLRGAQDPANPPKEPDAAGLVRRDDDHLIEAEIVTVPARLKINQAARVHITLRPNPALGSHWNNESTPLQVWVDGPAGWSFTPRGLEAPRGQGAESDEPRRLDLEVQPPPGARGAFELKAYALYNTCEQAGGQCLFLRQDLPIRIVIE
jgi:hypothetical protein